MPIRSEDGKKVATMKFSGYGPTLNGNAVIEAAYLAFHDGLRHDFARIPIRMTELIYRAGDVRLVIHFGNDLTWYMLGLIVLGVQGLVLDYFDLDEAVDFDFDLDIQGYNGIVATGYVV